MIVLKVLIQMIKKPVLIISHSKTVCLALTLQYISIFFIYIAI